MGIWDSFKNFSSGRQEKKIEKATRLIKNPKAIKEDRLHALEYFKGHEDAAAAVPALLQRFEYSLEHGINDAREKEMAMEGIMRHKDAAIPLVQEHLKVSTRIAWPIKVLTKIAMEDTVVRILLNCLNYEDVSFDQAIVDKNYDILCYLADYKVAGMADKLSHFLKDPDERVRFAAVEVIIRLDETGIDKLLEHFISDESSENRRLRAAVIDAFVHRRWQVSDPKKFGEAPIAEGVFVTKQGYLERRS